MRLVSTASLLALTLMLSAGCKHGASGCGKQSCGGPSCGPQGACQVPYDASQHPTASARPYTAGSSPAAPMTTPPAYPESSAPPAPAAVN